MEENEQLWHLTQTILNDVKLSFKAKGLFLYIVLTNEKKGLTLEMLQKKSKDSERSITIGLHELEKHGYAVRNTQKDGEVRWVYQLTNDISHDRVKEIKLSEIKQQPQRKKNQRKRSNKGRTATKKTGFKRALSKFFKEFF